MNFIKCEKLEKSMAELQFAIDAEAFKSAVAAVFKKEGKKYAVPGFRKGKAPRSLIEKMYGADVFTYDAINELFPAAFEQAVKEAGVEPVGRPEVSVDAASETEGVTLTVKVPVKPEVKIGAYSGLTVEKTVHTVDQATVDAELKRVQERNARELTREGAAENGDITDIDFEGFVDGVAFEGGKAEDYPLTIGSHTFIDNFEEQLIGKRTGEECEVNVTFPAEYHVEELKNKPAVFKVKVKEIQRKELPEANDDFASEVSDFDTMEEYKKDLTEKLQAEKIEAAKTADEDKVVAKVIENATMEIPDQMVEEQVNGMVNDYARRLESQGISFKQYVEITGMTAEKIGEQMKPQAIKRIQTRLVLEAVVKAENIQADDAAVEEQFDKMAEDFKMDKEQIKGMFGEEQMAQLKEDLAVQKAIDFLVAEAKFVD